MRIPRIGVLGAVFIAVSTTGCFWAGHTSSPWEFGGGIRVAPGFPAGNMGVSLHPMASVTYLSFDGGHDELYELGGQIRKSLPAASGLWIGAEAAVATLRTKGDTFSESTNGWSLTALVGAPVGKSRWGVNLYGGAGISNYGSSGKNIRVGIDLQPWFLKR
ncbi:MAG: hypothetical protein ABI877_13675 [Gemmatimonadaceae bacterium]